MNQRGLAQLSFFLLGPMRVLLDDQGVEAAFRTKKERALLAYLVIEGKKQYRREQLAELFWPGRPEGYARTNLRQAMLGLRRALGSEVLAGNEDYLSFELGPQSWLDTRQFLTLVQSSNHHPHRNFEDCEECARNLERAVELYRGDFLEDLLIPGNQDYQEWVIFHREQYFRLLLSAYQSLVEYFQARNEYESAYRFAWKYVNSAPLEEAAHRRLMNLQAIIGRRSAALEQYQTLCQILDRELGVQPSEKTRQLYEKIRSGAILDTRRAPVKPTPTNLPTVLTSFVGREDDLKSLRSELLNPDARLITLLGPAGVGKTRLAAQCANASREEFPDGVWFVDLREAFSARLLAMRIAEATGLSFDESDEFRTQLHHQLQPLKSLLILDPFEQLVHATNFVLELLQNAPDLKIIITSRYRLNYQAACSFQIVGLPYPSNSEPIESIESYPAVQLFLARAQQNRVPVPANLTAQQMVVEICQLLEGLPLAIELAAAALREHSLGHLLDGLHSSLEILRANLEDMPREHRSMRAALRSSWNLLSEEEQEAFQRLSIFSGEFRSEEALLLAGIPFAILESLVDHSLLRKVRKSSYRLSTLMRLFAAEKLEENSPGTSGARPFFQTIPARKKSVRVRTGPLNLELFSDRLEHTLARAIRHRHAAALILLDIQKWANSATEDETEARKLLQEAGQRISDILRGTDSVSYLGEARFAIVLDEIADPRDTQVVASKLLKNLQQLAAGGPVNLMRLGISLYPQDGSDAARLYATAQEQLQIA